MKVPVKVDLVNKIPDVTGGSGVLGVSLSRALAKAGATVAVLARNQEKIDRAVQTINDEGGKAVGYSANGLDKKELERVHANLAESYGPSSISTNGAGRRHSKASWPDEYPSKQTILDTGE